MLFLSSILQKKNISNKIAEFRDKLKNENVHNGQQQQMLSNNSDNWNTAAIFLALYKNNPKNLALLLAQTKLSETTIIEIWNVLTCLTKENMTFLHLMTSFLKNSPFNFNNFFKTLKYHFNSIFSITRKALTENVKMQK